MKAAPLLLLASVAANVALVAVIYRRSASVPLAPSPASLSAAAKDSAAKPSEALRAALLSGDIAALQAAGFSPEVAREIALGRAFARFAERLRAAKTGGGEDGRWWRRGTNAGSLEQETQARRELSGALIAVFGEDFGFGGGNSGQLSFLPADKRAALARITQDYDEMIAKFSAHGIQLASDREKLQLLRAERQRDIAALLTPAELAEYEMRTSASAALLRSRFGDAIASEEDFKKLYALQKAFDDKYPMAGGRMTMDSMRERNDAQRQLQADMRASLGPDAFAALTRAADPDLRTLEALVARLNLPATTAGTIASQRDTFAAESQRIAHDPALTPQQRFSQLQDLGTRAKSGLVSILGTEGAEAYAQRSPWMNMLQSGMAYSTNPQDGPMGGMPGGPTVVPVMPLGPPGTNTRQVVNFSAAEPAPGGPGTGAVFFSAGVAPAGDVPRMTTLDVISIGPDFKAEAGPGVATPAIISAPVLIPSQPAPPANGAGQSVPAPRG